MKQETSKRSLKSKKIFEKLMQSKQQFEENKNKEEAMSLKDIQHNDNDFICPICLNYIVSAVSTKCGHTYCEVCLHEYLLYFKDCPLCNENMRKSKFGQCLILDQLIQDFIKQAHPEETQLYEKRRTENKKWKTDKQYICYKVKSFDVGEQLDVRDPNFIWKVGIIRRLKLCHDSQRTKFLVIHYVGWSEKYDEEIPESSPRFASFGFYTNRKDIPRYNRMSKNPFLKKMLIVENYEYNLQKKVKDVQFFLMNDDSSSSIE